MCRQDQVQGPPFAHSSTVAWRIPGPGSLAGYSPGGHREPDRDLTTKRRHQAAVQSSHRMSAVRPFWVIITIQARAITQLRMKPSEPHSVG